MGHEPAEIPLRGGRVTAGVVRVGDTVRRPTTPNSGFVRRLLLHLADRGFDGAPAALGTDTEGRDVFAFVEGVVPADLGFHDDGVLGSAGRLIRRFHDLGAALVADQPGAEVVCHNDLSPCNFVFREGIPLAIIDFDAAAPGTRAADLGYAAWLWLDIGAPDITATEQARRLGVFLDGYGFPDRAAVLAAMVGRQAALEARGRKAGSAAMAAWASACRAWTRANADILGVRPAPP